MYLVRHPLQLVLVTCILALLANSAAGKPQLNRMNLYSVLQIQYVPGTVQLRDDSGHFLCAGALISDEVVVTVADCLDEIDFTKVTVVAGATTLTEEGVQRLIAKITVHPDYNKKTGHSNLVVLKLNESLPTGEPGESNICSYPLRAEPAEATNTIQTPGWRHLTESYGGSDKLYGTRIDITSLDECYEVFNAAIDHGVFCARGNDYDDQYLVSDMGGPALYNSQLCGIAQSCKNCDEIDYTVKYTDLYYFRDFIKAAMA